MKASELRKIALEKQEERFWDNYNMLIHYLNEYIEFAAGCGSTYVKLVSACWDRGTFLFDNHTFPINFYTYKEMKRYYKERGFKVRWTLIGDNIEISW